MEVVSIRTPGLGDSTYLLTHAGLGVLVDPQRDANRFLQAIADAKVRLRYVLETHVHNDYVSGGREVAQQSGASLVLPAAAGVAFDHVPAFHLEEIGDATLSIRPLHTPGHTAEHVSYLVLIDSRPVALFSGGSLLVGSAGRTDLLGKERAWQLALAQYRSVHRLAQLPDDVGLYPTHGEGSFCTASGAGRETSTIGQEKQGNPIFAYPDARAFATGQLAGLGQYPAYYAFMGPINLLGPTPLPEPAVPELTPDAVQALAGELPIVDTRPRAVFAAGHIPGALGIELGDDFATWVGWLLPFNSPLVLVLDREQDVRAALTALGRVGFDRIRGALRGMETWRREGLPVATFTAVDARQFREAVADGTARQVLDVRATAEWEAGHLEGSVHRYLPDLLTEIPKEIDRAEPVWLACASGLRATIAAGLLERAGYRPIVLTEGGVPDILRAIR